MKEKNLFIIGSESHISKDYIEIYGSQYDNIVGIDLSEKSNLEYYQKIDFRDKNCFTKLNLFLKDISLNYSDIIFTSGVNYMNDIFSINFEDWDRTFNINVRSALFSIKSLYSYFYDEVSLVFVASQNGVVGHDKRIDYGSSKSALIHLVKNLSVDFSKVREKDIRINCVSPSYIKNKDNEQYMESHSGKVLLKRIPYKRFVLLRDISNTIEFLLSKNSIAIRGQNIIIDYGYTII